MRRIQTINLLHQKKNRFDWWLFGCTIFFALFGLLMIYESSNVSAFKDFGDQYHYVRDQSFFMIIGVAIMIIASFISYKRYYHWSLYLMILTLILLFFVFIPGFGIKALGAHRWINLGFINFQPAELTKITLIIYLSAWFSNKEKGRLLPFLLLLIMIVGLIILQPDLGTAIIITSIAVILYFLSGAPLWQFLMIVPMMTTSVLLLAVTSPYRFQRLTTFLNPSLDPLGASYHIRQILITLGSGGLFGIGLGASRQKYQFLPEATTDSIFAIIGEEFGFIGALFFVALYIFLLYRIYKIARNTKDIYGFLLSCGIFAFFACQAVINLGAITALLPLTGVPLPLISYGGSNLMVSLASIGILLNIGRNNTS